MKNILFLCTGNSCRSILAEALLNNLGKNRFIAYSAGSFPIGQINSDSLKILQTNKLPILNLASKSWHTLEFIEFDIVITVCDNAAAETCPLYLGNAINAHWGISDPDKVKGTARPLAFDKAFNQLVQRIEKLVLLADDDINETQLNLIGTHST